MLENIILAVAILLSVVALVMIWLANYQSKTLAKQIQGVNSRISSLNHDIEIEQRKAEQELNRLRLQLKQIQGEPVDVPPAAGIEEAGPPQIKEISPQALKARLDQGDEVIVVDMRQPFEFEAGHIPGSVSMFVQDIPDRAGELPHDKEIVFQCWSGNTSLQACAYLMENGWAAEQVASLSGGIAGWTQAYGMESLVRDGA